VPTVKIAAGDCGFFIKDENDRYKSEKVAQNDSTCAHCAESMMTIGFKKEDRRKEER